jgi:hypothetical protein
VVRTICAPACKARAYSLIEGSAEEAAAFGRGVVTACTCARIPICEIDRAVMESGMNRRRILVVIALAALVAGTAALVHAQNEAPKSAPGAAGQAPKVLYDFNALPDPVKRMLEQIAAAAQSGEIENMRPVFESNELKPMVAAAYVEDPIAYWKKQSADGTGRDVLAAMLNVMSAGYVRVAQAGDEMAGDEMYVWPYFAEIDLGRLTPAQEVELYRIIAPSLAMPMKKDGKYSYYRLGISPSGVWHYFIQ